MTYRPPVKGIVKKNVAQSAGQDLAQGIGSVVEVANRLNNLEKTVHNAVSDLDQKKKEVDDAVSTLEDTTIQILQVVKEIKQGPPGASPDENTIVNRVLDRVPKVDERRLKSEILSYVPTIDYAKITKEVLKKIPENKASLQIIKENMEVDPLAIIDKIMSLPEETRSKLQLGTSNISGLDQTIKAFQNQLGRGYLHGGGLSTVSHDATLTGTGTPTDPLKVVGGGSGVSSFNTRTGAVTLISSDVTTALGYTPLQNITGLVSAGTNVTITGTGTFASPYVINSSGSGTNYWQRTGTILSPLTAGDSIFTSSGIALGTATLANNGLNTAHSYTDPGAGSPLQEVLASVTATATTGSNANQVNGLNGVTLVGAGNTQNWTSVSGFIAGQYSSTVLSGATGTISNMGGLRVLVNNQASGATITNAYSIKLVSPTMTGAMTNFVYLLAGSNIQSAGNYFIDGTNVTYQSVFGGSIGLGSIPTHSLTLASTTTGAAFYNTTDQTVNYERVREFWSGNVFNWASESGGTGTIRNFALSGGNLSILKPGIGATASDALIITNTTAAAAGAQQYSGTIHFNGQGFATTPAVSRTVDFRQYLVPVQGTTNPTGTLTIDASINGGAYTTVLTLDSSGNLTNTGFISTAGTVFAAGAQIGGNVMIGNGTISSSATSTNATFNVVNGTGANSQSVSQYQFASSTTNFLRTAFYGSFSQSLSTGANYSSVLFGNAPITTFATGTHAWLANVVVKPIGTVTSSGAAITNTATFYIDGASSAGSNNYALYVASGGVSFQSLSAGGLVKSTAGLLSIASSGTDYQSPITLTTTGTSGAATFVGNTLNIPNYANTTYSAGTGLTLTTTTFSVNTSQNISTLSNLTSNGVVMTTGGTGALSVVANNGTGTNVLTTSPALVTPDLGTPTALVGTNITGTGTGFTSGITNALKSATTTVNVSSATAPTSGQVLTATGGSAATWQTPSAPVSKLQICTVFENSARFTINVSTGTATFGTQGLALSSGSSSGQYACVGIYGSSTNMNPFNGSPSATWSCNIQSAPTTAVTWMLIGNDAYLPGATTSTTKHVGFKIIWSAGTGTLYGTQADGTTESVTAGLTTLAIQDQLDLIAVMNGTSSVTYYYSKNGGAQSSATVSTNVPTGNAGGAAVILSVAAVCLAAASSDAINFQSMSYQR